MLDSDYLAVIKLHPNTVEVSYKDSSTVGILDFNQLELFDNGIKRIYDKKLTVLTSKIAEITKNTDPMITCNGKQYKINDHYQETKQITILVLQ